MNLEEMVIAFSELPLEIVERASVALYPLRERLLFGGTSSDTADGLLLAFVLAKVYGIPSELDGIQLGKS